MSTIAASMKNIYDDAFGATLADPLCAAFSIVQDTASPDDFARMARCTLHTSAVHGPTYIT